MSHEWLIRFVEHRIGDRGPPAHGLDSWGMVRLIRKWLKVGVMEEGRSSRQRWGRRKVR